jgi:PAS domain S-box-containing protein
MGQNVSDYTPMDETLRSPQEWLQEIFQSFNDVAWSADPIAWNALFVSQNAEAIYGYPVSAFFDNPHLWRSLIHPSDRDRVERLLPVLFSTGMLNFEYQIVRPSGEIRWLYHRLRLIRDTDGEVLRIDGLATDITEIKSNGWINAARRDCSPTTEPEISYPTQYCSDQADLNPSASLPEQRIGMLDSLACTSCRYCCQALPARWASPRFANGERFVANTITGEGLGERLAELPQNQHLIQKIANTTPYIIYLFDLLESRTVYINHQVFEILGYTVEEVYAEDGKWLPNLIHPDDLHTLDNAPNRLASLGEREATEVSYRMRHKNGEWRWLEMREVVFTRNTDGSPQQILGSIKDITRRKQVEETLRLQAERERLTSAIAQRIRQSLNLDEILTTTVEEVRQLLQNDRVLLFKLGDDSVGRVVTESVALGLPATAGMEFPDEVFPEQCYHYYCQGLPRIVPDITRDQLAPCLTEFLQQLKVKSKLVIPILCSNQQGISTSSASQTSLWGVMVAHDCSGNRQWQQWEIDLLSALATQIGIAIQQSELYLQLEAQLTELQQAEAALQQAKDAAEVANHAKSEFLANMSHELRTPLNGILGYAQILKKDTNLTAHQQNSLSIIHHCGEHLLTLIEDILDLSKIEAQKMELSTAEFHLPNFLKSLSDLFRMRAQQKDISFTYEILAPLPNGVIGDKKRLRQVLLNLLSNAVKFTDRGGVTFKVGSVELGIGEKSFPPQTQIPNSHFPIFKIHFQVEDTGIGIEPSKLGDIFLPFHQVSDRAHAVEGTGLGLAISQKLVQLMGSEIQVRSTLGEGSIFYFDLELPSVAEWHEPNHLIDSPIVGYKGHKRKVLIVDDYQINRSLFRELLERVGFEVLEAVNGLDGLNKAIEFQPDVILMDVLMPVLDGLDATQRLRQLPQFKNVVLIALSANVFESTQQESWAAGCQDFLPKPVQAEQLLDAIAKHLGLEWIYDERQCSTGVELNVDVGCFIPPPPSEIAALSELIKMGDIAGIIDRTEQWKILDGKLVPFAKQIYQLAKGFKLKQIRDFIQQYRYL